MDIVNIIAVAVGLCLFCREYFYGHGCEWHSVMQSDIEYIFVLCHKEKCYGEWHCVMQLEIEYIFMCSFYVENKYDGQNCDKQSEIQYIFDWNGYIVAHGRLCKQIE